MSPDRQDHTLTADKGAEATLSGDRTRPTRDQPQLELPRGTSVGRYVVLERLGAGGMGVVYAAYDPELDRKIALKLVATHSAGGKGSSGATRLIREAQAMAKLHHQGVIVVHDVGTYRQQVFIAMEYLDGGTLTAWAHKEDRPWRETLDILLRAGAGLAAAHEAGIMHRDFKPDNVLLGTDGRVRVMDFGLARSLLPSSEGASSDEIGKSLESLDVQLTATGARVGTPAFMSPEQHLSHQVDARSDQFSFCVTAFVTLYGLRPFAGETLPELTSNVLQAKLRSPPAGHGVPAWIEPHLRRGLERDPDKRFESMRALLDVLSVDVSAKRRSLLRTAGLAAAALGIVGVAGGVFAFGTRPCKEGRSRVTEVWNVTARESGRSAFGNSGQAGADATWVETAGALDGYADAWTAMYTEACRATHVEGDQSPTLLDRRINCLERRRTALRTAVDVLADADAVVVQRADKVIDGLPLIDDCADVDALLAQLDPPRDAIRPRVDAVVSALAEVAVLRTVARFKKADEVLGGLEGEVDAIDYPPTRTEYLYFRSAVASDRGRVEEAEKFAYATVDAAAISHHDSMAADAWLSLAVIVGITQRNFAQVEPILHAASAAGARGGSPRHRPRLLSTWGTIELLREDYPAAEAKLLESVALFKEIAGPDARDTLETLERLALVYHGQERYDEAEPMLRRIREVREELLGPEHPDVGQVLGNLARLYKAQGHLDKALPMYERSLAIMAKVNGPRHPIVATAHHNLSNALRNLGRFDEAETHLDVAQSIDEELFGTESAAAGHDMHSRGTLLLARGDAEAALPVFDKSLAIWTAALGEDHGRVGYALTSRGRALNRLERYADAVAPLERALEIRAAPDTAPAPEIAMTHFELARALWATNTDRPRARTLAAKAEQLFVAAKHPDDAKEVADWLQQLGSD